MTTLKSSEKWLTCDEAAKKLNVSILTIQTWAKLGRVKAKPIQVTRTVYMIDPASLKDAKKAKCIVCGKIFVAKHPRRAKFCCTKHRMAFHYVSSNDALLKQVAKK